MTKRQTPPARNSNWLVVVVKPSGPHHAARCAGSLKAENASARGASIMRVPTIDRGSRSRSMLFLALTLSPSGLQRFEIITEAVKPFLPEPAIFGKPVVDWLKGGGFELARPPLRFARARDQPSVFQHL